MIQPHTAAMTRLLKIALATAIALLLAACGGDSSSGASTSNSPFVGTYKGTAAVEVRTHLRSRSASQDITVFVHRDGLVQVGETDASVHASGPLDGDSVVLGDTAAALIDPDCTGTVALDGSFSFSTNGNALFQGRWSSQNTVCFGVPGALGGRLTAQRTAPTARGSRVFQTGNPAMREAFRRAATR